MKKTSRRVALRIGFSVVRKKSGLCCSMNTVFRDDKCHAIFAPKAPHRLKFGRAIFQGLFVAGASAVAAASGKFDYHCFIRNEGLPRNRSVNTIEIMASIANSGIVGTENA
jgi:hypothetical protein